MARDIFTRFRRKAKQFEATRGRPIAPSVSRRFLEAEIASEAERSGVEAERAERITGLRVGREQREEEIEAQRQANIVSGVTGLGTAAAVLSDTPLGEATGRAITGAAKRVAPSILPSATSATVATPIASTAATETAALTGAEIATPITGTAATATTVAPTLAGTAASVALPSVVGGFVGSKISEAIGGEGKGARNTGRVLGSAAAGFAFGGPLGGAIGGVIGLAQSETVICTELYRQGYIPKEVFTLDDHTMHSDITEEIYNGYMKWAPKVVEWMQKSKLVTQLVRPFGVSWAYHMAHKLDKSIPDSLIGKILYKIGVPICNRLGNKIRDEEDKANGKFLRISR